MARPSRHRPLSPLPEDSVTESELPGGHESVDLTVTNSDGFLRQTSNIMGSRMNVEQSIRRLVEDGLVEEDEDSTVRWDDEMMDDAKDSSHDGKIQEEFNELARNKAVNRVKIMVVVMLVCATVLVSVLVWHFTKTDEERDFVVQYDTFSRKAIESFMHNMDTKVWAAYTLASVFTSRFSPETMATQMDTFGNDHRVWPNVTMTDFGDQTKGTNVLAHSRAIFFTPLLTKDTFHSWNAYARNVYKQDATPELDQPNQDEGLHAKVKKGVYRIDEEGKRERETGEIDEYYFPVWHISPRTINLGGFLFNEYSEPLRRSAIDRMLDRKKTSITSFLYRDWDYHSRNREQHREPRGILFSPVFQDFTRSTVVGTIGVDFDWSMNFRRLLPDNMAGLSVVLNAGDGREFTYSLDGAYAEFLGPGDLHDRHYDDMELRYRYNMPDEDATVAGGRKGSRKLEKHNPLEWHEESAMATSDAAANSTDSSFEIRIYPTRVFEQTYVTSRPVILCVVVALVFFFTSMAFIVYDCLVENRQAAVMNRALQTSKIVHSLFPATVRERLFTTNEVSRPTRKFKRTGSGLVSTTSNPNARLKKFLSGPQERRDESTVMSSIDIGEPIADMFPNTSILFADIAGFTAWSSERQPSQVFTLLENIYREFDLEAKKYNVFKIETIGDCYVAATGLPDPQDDHAVVMARFAYRCLVKFIELTKELEISLGPGTAALGIRIGIHSGAVTAGVLRGEKSRFQLFGDTMNTASRMESSGTKNKIQASPETAALIKQGGKEHWLSLRSDIVTAKGKGEIQTYWVRPKSAKSAQASVSTGDDNTVYPSVAGWESDDDLDKEATARKMARGFSAIGTAEDDMNRLVKWNAAVLEDLLLKVMVHRQVNEQREREAAARKKRLSSRDFATSLKSFASGGQRHSSDSSQHSGERKNPKNPYLLVDEITDEVSFATYQPKRKDPIESSDLIESIGEAAKEELQFYVACIASLYRNVHFHSFEHACHVLMSANKLMRKVCSRKDPKQSFTRKGEAEEIDLFFKTFGISSDPLAQFAVVFSALVHDVDHFGITNTELIKDRPEFAERYNNISVAEQNSIHVAWELLMEPDFPNLRKCIFGKKEDRHRFKQLLIHMIIATDIADKDRMKKEKERWNVAFENISEWENEWRNKPADELAKVDVSFKATAVLEQLMLASDIAHTMQHWITYIKWNERLFKERMVAYLDGLSPIDPRTNWYKSEIGFFDFYIIPLAKRLKECGVFGTAGDEYLGYALKNRQEWTEKGEGIVAKYLQWVEDQEPEGFEDTNRIS